MKEILIQIENQLLNVVETSSVVLFGIENGAARIISALVAALGQKIKTGPDGSLSAPNIFILNIPRKYSEDIRHQKDLFNRLAEELSAAGCSVGVKFPVPVSINIFPNANLEDGNFHLRALRSTSTLPPIESHQTNPDALPLAELDLPTPTGDSAIPENCFLIVAGSKIFSFEEAVINVGRKLDNQLVIDDPRISRHHCQIRVVEGQYHIFDLDSSGGSFVNGERIQDAALHPGDVISLAGVPMVYGKDAGASKKKAQQYDPPAVIDENKKTTSNLKVPH